jgi:hypothetical protein
MVGGAGMALGEDTALPAALVHPFIVCVTVYVDALKTVIDGVVAPLFHNNAPV